MSRTHPPRPGSQPPPGSPRRRAATPFIARSAELERLIAAVTMPPSIVAVSGHEGLGKTRLITAASDALGSDPRLLVGRCRRLRDPFPLGPMAEVVRDLGPDLAGWNLSPVSGALRPLVPELADLLPDLPAPSVEPADRLMRRHQLFRALVEVLRAVGDAVLVIEDVHWADPHTIEFLSYLLDEPLPDLSIVVTYRGGEVQAQVPALIARHDDRLTVHRITLDPWDASATGEMAAAMLGIDRVSDELATHLCHRSSGIPLAVHELMRLLLERGSVTIHDGEWVRRAIEELDVPVGIRDPVRERMSMLDDPEREVLEAAAVLQLPVPPDVLGAVADLPDERLGPALRAAQRSGLLLQRERGYELIHVLAAQAIYDSLEPTTRRELHRRAAAALQGLSTPPLGQLAHHLYGSDQTEKWIDAAEAAADQAWAAGDDEEVVNLLEPVLREAPLDPRRRFRVAKVLGRSAIYSPRAGEIARQLAALVSGELEASPGEVAEVRLTTGQILSNAGSDPTLMRELATSAFETVELRAHRRIQAVALSSRHHEAGARRDQLLDRLDQAATLVRESIDDEEAMYASALVAEQRLRLGDSRWRDGLSSVVLRGAPQRLSEALATYYVANGACLSGHYELARRLVRSCLSTDDKRTMPPTLVVVVRALCDEIDFWCGEWDELDTSLRRNLEARMGAAVAHDREQAVLGALTLSRSGPTDDTAQALDAALELADSVGNLDAIAHAAGARARIQTVRDSCQIFPGLDTYVDAVRSGMVLPSMFRGLPAVARLLATGGRADRAQQLVDAMEVSASELETPLAGGGVRHARGHLAAAGRCWQDAADHYLAASRRHDAASMPYEAALAREDAAVAMTAAGSVGAGEPLRTAIGAYDRLGAGWDLDRATGLARRHAISVPARHRAGPRGYGDDLSPREREVAKLAATGQTNREIAEALFLSVHTVNKHLSAALRKLELTSRRQLRGQAESLGDAVEMNG